MEKGLLKNIFLDTKNNLNYFYLFSFLFKQYNCIIITIKIYLQNILFVIYIDITTINFESTDEVR